MKILVFTEGTVIMHRSALGHAPKKLRNWQIDGAEIAYLTSRKVLAEVEQIRNVLKEYNFPDGRLFYRHKGERYEDIVERVNPDILVEDDCESIGGASQMIVTHLKPRIRKRTRVVVVKEFVGIDHLADTL